MTDPDARRLRDILDAIERIRRYAPAERSELVDDEVTQDAIVHRFMVIGEAASALSKELRDAHPEVPWKSITGMRHIIVHDYDRVNINILWDAIDNHLPQLERTIRGILDDA